MDESMMESVSPDPLAKLRKDLRDSAALLSSEEARFLVDLYYTAQNDRIRGFGQVRASSSAGEPHAIVQWAADSFERIENEIKGALKSFAQASETGRWAMSIHGIGPVIAAGLLCHIDIERASTVGHIWAFAGLDPTRKWEKKTKRPWNAALKRLCWIIGGSFVRARHLPGDVYGKVYDARKAYEIEKNLRGDYASLAEASLSEKRWKDSQTKTAYEAGRLPDGRIDLRARRYATKLFLSHYHSVAYECHYGVPPAAPYSISILDHAHWIKPPNWPME